VVTETFVELIVVLLAGPSAIGDHPLCEFVLRIGPANWFVAFLLRARFLRATSWGPVFLRVTRIC
jgi:hypothetical protein